VSYPMSSNTLRTGKRVYRGVSNSPNFKGVTAVRPMEAMQDLQKRNTPKLGLIQRAAQRRIRNGSTS
jgi:hypothetical protein